MKQDAEAHADEDKKKKEQVEMRNVADTMVYTSEKMLAEHRDKVSDDEAKTLQEKIDALKALKDGEDIEAIKNASEELSQKVQELGAKMYQSEEQNQDGSSDGSEQKDEAKDAEYEEVKGEKEKQEGEA